MENLDARLSEIDEMVKSHSRAELNAMALEVGIDTSVYPDKRTVAEAILIAKDKLAEEIFEETQVSEEVEPAVVEEKPLEYTVSEVIQEQISVEEVEMTTETVRGKIMAIKAKTVEFRENKPMRNSIIELSQKFAGYANAEYQDSLASFRESVNHSMHDIEDYRKSDFQSGVKVLQQSVSDFRQSILDQCIENRKYANQFWG